MLGHYIFMLETIKSFYFIRHGESEANAHGYYAGQLNSPLTLGGENQIKQISGVLENLTPLPDVILHSGLKRSLQTAIILNQVFQKPLQCHEDLKEQHYGDLQGKPKKSVRQVHGEEHWLNPPGGETLEIFQKRVFRALEAACVYKMPMIVGHGGFLRAFIHYYCAGKYDTPNGVLFYFKKAESGQSASFPWDVYEFDTKKCAFEDSVINQFFKNESHASG